MRDGFIKVAAATPLIEVADCMYNAGNIAAMMREAHEAGVRLAVFPELCLTGYTCGELFLQETLLDGALEALRYLAAESADLEMAAIVGLPMLRGHKLYNVAAVICRGRVLGFVPKRNLPNYSEFYEARHFEAGNEIPVNVNFDGRQVPFGTNIIFECRGVPGFSFAAEICEDLWVCAPPSESHAVHGAMLIANLSASDEITGKDNYRRSLVTGQSGRLVCGYIYADAGEGESTQDLVFSGHDLIAENGVMLAESERFGHGMIISEIDVQKLMAERRRMTTYKEVTDDTYVRVPFEVAVGETKLTRHIDPAPFVPGDRALRRKRCEEILTIQAMGLKKRLVHTKSRHAVVGISGGLDSTLALLVTSRAFDMAGIDRKAIIAVTMPCFGTTDRTYRNACTLVRKLGATLREVDIKAAVRLHFEDIGQDPQAHDVTYENSQARERTQVLMDIANQCGGLVIGTGDLSELALGWATYNGDHMSMYGVNASIPKTLVRHLVRYFADTCRDGADGGAKAPESQGAASGAADDLSATLYDILDTPVSPELIPPKDGEISQRTEDLVGPYELHDFFLYYMLRFGMHPAKIFRLAQIAFEGTYDRATIYKWLRTFYRRFFSQQFKRSCLPDGPKVGSVAVSPRGDLRMPSDASVRLWMREIDEIAP